MSNKDLIQEADNNKNKIDRNVSYTKEQLAKLDNSFQIAFIYSSNSIDGNTLTHEETKKLLIDGITSNGKPIKDYFEVSGLAEAFDYMLQMGRADQLEITEDVIKRLHYLYYYRVNRDEAGQYRNIQEATSGEKILMPKSEDVPHLMEHFTNQMQNSRRFMHPIEYAAICHKRLIEISPFRVGNGSVARLLMNLILVHAGYGVTCIPPEKSERYKGVLVLSQNKSNPNVDPLIDFIAECVIEAEKVYCH